MEFWLSMILICACSIWVYWDATENKIGKIPDEAGVFNMSAGNWAAVTIGLFIVGFPAYLINRTRLIEKAKENPRESTFRNGGMTILAVITLGAAYFAYSAYAGGSVPRCDSGDVVALTERLVADNPILQQMGGDASISAHAESSYDAETEVRRCSAVIRMSSGEERVFYTVSWHNKSAGEFWVEFTN